MSPEPLVSFHGSLSILDRGGLRAFARALRDRITGGRDFHCVITTDAELRRLNRSFLGKDYSTDVLSFPAAEPPSLGDIAISCPRARKQSQEFHHSLETELKILMLHGVLHLMGMDHEKDHGRMARAESEWRAKLGLPAGLIDRAHA